MMLVVEEAELMTDRWGGMWLLRPQLTGRGWGGYQNSLPVETPGGLNLFVFWGRAVLESPFPLSSYR